MTQRSHQESNADGNVSPKGNSNLGANRTLTTILTALKVLVTWKRCWAVPPVLHCLLNAVPAVRMPRGRSQHRLWTRTDDKSLNIQADPVDIYKPRVSWVASQSGEARWCFFCKSALLCELFQTILGFTAHICPIHTSFFCHLKCWRKQNKTQLTTLIQLFLLFIHFFTDIHKAQACWVLRSFPWLWLGFFFFLFFIFLPFFFLSLLFYLCVLPLQSKEGTDHRRPRCRPASMTQFFPWSLLPPPGQDAELPMLRAWCRRQHNACAQKCRCSESEFWTLCTANPPVFIVINPPGGNAHALEDMQEA